MPPVPEALQRAFLRPLRYRPLLWMALAALAGVVGGGWWALVLGHNAPNDLTRSDWRLIITWPLVPVALAIAALFRQRPWMWRFALASALFCGFMGATARRIAPPPGDVSHLTRLDSRPLGPVMPLELTLHGIVADSPRRGEFNTQFPLQCLPPLKGTVWVSLSPRIAAEVGDEVRFRARLLPLTTPSNPGERISFWSQLGNSCWCEARRVSAFQLVRPRVALPLERGLDAARAAILARFERLMRGDNSSNALAKRPFPGATAQLLTAMVFGEGGLTHPLPRQVRDDFRVAGLSHLLVASGAQISILALGLLFLGRKLSLPSWLVVLGAIPIVETYVLLVGGGPSIGRAAIVGILVGLALVVGRETDGLSMWSAALLGSLFLDPLVAWSLSWQLTFAATWGLIALAPLLWNSRASNDEGPTDRSRLLEGVALTMGAQLAVAPISLFHFGSWSVAGLGANLAALPLAAMMVFTGALGLVFAPLTGLNYWMARGVMRLAHDAANLPGASLANWPFSLLKVWLFYLVLGLMLTFRWPDMRSWAQEGLETLASEFQNRFFRFKNSFNPLFALGALVLLAAILTWWKVSPAPAQLRLVMLDVGQGESLLLISPRGRAVLIDGGSLDARTDVGEGVIVPALQAYGIEHLDAVFLTHSDADHCNALRSVLREISVDAFVDGAEAARQLMARQGQGSIASDGGAADYQALRSEVARQNIPVVVPIAGQTWEFDGAKITALAPLAPAFEKRNENCLVLRAQWGQSAMLLTGDLERDAEERLVRTGVPLKANILKVSHHGSRGSSSPLFLHAVSPQVALISCGKYNTFGHPAPATLQRLHASGAREFRTDLDGAIEVDCDISQCRVWPSRD